MVCRQVRVGQSGPSAWAIPHVAPPPEPGPAPSAPHRELYRVVDGGSLIQAPQEVVWRVARRPVGRAAPTYRHGVAERPEAPPPYKVDDAVEQAPRLVDEEQAR